MNEIAKSLGEMNLQERADLMAAVADGLQATAEEAEEDGDTLAVIRSERRKLVNDTLIKVFLS